MDIVTIKRNSKGKKQQIRLDVSTLVKLEKDSKWERFKKALKNKLKSLDPRPDFDDL